MNAPDKAPFEAPEKKAAGAPEAPAAADTKRDGNEHSLGGGGTTRNQGDKPLAPAAAPANTAMTVGERLELCKLVRLRARVARADVVALGAKHAATVERELSARYSADDAAWTVITSAAEQAIAEANAKVAALCASAGIRPEFRPSLYAGWSSRGENAIAGRRAELRAAAKAAIDDRVKAAHAAIERRALEQQTQLMAGALSSAEAQAFLAAMPTVDQLLPAVAMSMLPALEGVVRSQAGRQHEP